MSVRGIRADANAPLVAGGDMGYVGSGGGGSPYMRGLAEHFFFIFNRNVFDFFKVQVLFISY